jgi:hypothetical protein
MTSKVLSSLYSIIPISTLSQVASVQEISKDLSEWRADLAKFLEVDVMSTSLFLPIFQRQQNVLNMTYLQAMILTHHPYVLTSFTRLPRRSKKDINDKHHDLPDSPFGQSPVASLP